MDYGSGRVGEDLKKLKALKDLKPDGFENKEVCWENGKEGTYDVLETVWNMKERVGMWAKMATPVWHVALGEAAHSLLSASITIDVWGRNPSLGNHPRAF